MPRRSPAPQPAPACRRLWLVALLVLGLGAAGLGWWFWPPAGPAPPAVELGSLDPEVAETIAAARAEVESHRQSALAWGRLGMVLYAHDFLPEALTCFEHAQRLDPAEIRWPYHRGVILLVDQPDEAIAALTQAAACRGEEGVVRLRLAEALLERGCLDEAAGQLALLQRQQPAHPRVALQLGQLALRCGDARASLPLLTQAAEQPLTRKAASVVLAEAYQQLGQHDAAAKARRQALEASADPPWTDPYLEEVQGLWVGAVGRTFRAQKLLAQGDEQRARRLLLETVQKYPEFYRAHALLAARCFQTGEWEAAEQWLREAVRLAPQFERTRIQLGVVLLLRGEPAEATAQFRAVLDYNPNSADAYFYLGQALQKQGNLAGAVDAFRSGLRYQPDSAHLHVYLSKALAQQGQKADAHLHLRHAVQLASPDPQVQQLIQEIEAALRPDKSP